MNGYDARAEKLLESSVEQYRELCRHAETLADMLDKCEYSGVRDHAAQLQQLQAVACEWDERLLPLIERDLPAWERHPFYRMRLDFINAILERNALILPKIRGMMAVTSAELGQLRSGHTMLSGYAGARGDQRGLRGIG